MEHANNEKFAMKFVMESANKPKYLSLAGLEACGASFIFSTRLHGISSPPFASLNMAYTTADDPERIRTNRELFFRHLGEDARHAIYMQQTHGKDIAIASKADIGRGASDYQSGFPATDGILTDCPGLMVCGCFADCVPVWLYDPFRRAGGVIHAGWKGTAQAIARAGVHAMVQHFNSQLEQIIVGIGPSIGPCCFFVDEATCSEILSSLPEEEREGVVTGQSESGMYVNLWQINIRQLELAGVLSANIYLAGQCTCCEADLYHSFRRDKDNSGRMTAVFRMGG